MKQSRVQEPEPEARFTKAIHNAKRNGRLMITNMNLTEFPESIHKFNEITPTGDNWWEDIPLTSLDFSHNSIKYLYDNPVKWILGYAV